MKRKIISKLICMLIAAVIVAGVWFVTSVNAESAPAQADLAADANSLTDAGSNDEGEKNNQETQNKDVLNKENDAADGEKNVVEEKSETVFVKASAQGDTLEVKVSEWLKISEGAGKIEDVSILKDIANVEGDEEFTSKSDGMLYWDNHGANISYEGTTDKELPVSVKVSYFLDGKKVTPEELAGKSGEVRIRFDYENHTKETVLINDREVESVVPFMMCTILYLPSDIFSDVEAVNGKIIESEGQTVAVGMVLPGLSENLKLSEYEPTEEIEIPEYFEITANVTEFELEFTATVAMTDFLEDLETEDLDELEDMIDDMKELQDATAEMEDGVGELLDGVEEVAGYVGEYVKAVDTLDIGVKQLKKGMEAINEQNEALCTGAATLEEGLSQLNTTLSQISLPEGSTAGMEAMSGAAIKLMEDTAALKLELESMSNSLAQMQAFKTSAESYKQQTLAKLASIQTKVEAIDINALNEASRSKAKEAVAGALAESGLTEDVIAQIQANADAKIDSTDFTTDILVQISEIKNEFTELPGLDIPETNISSENVNTLIADIQTQLAVLEASAQGLASAGADLAELNKSFESLKTGVSQLAGGSSQLTKGITAYTGGVNQVYEGVKALKEGTGELAYVGGEFIDGFDEMIDGIGELKDGVKEFNEEITENITDLAGDELRNVLDGVRAVKIRSDKYNNFAGITEGTEGSVVFIIETEGIEK